MAARMLNASTFEATAQPLAVPERVCQLCKQRFANRSPYFRHLGLHNNVAHRMQRVDTASVVVDQVRDRVRYAVKQALGRQTRPLPGNRIRASIAFTLDMLESEFLALFGHVREMTLSYYHDRRKFKLELVGAEVVAVLNGVLGHDWDNAEKRSSGFMVYVCSVNVRDDRHYPVNIIFDVTDDDFVEQPTSGARLQSRAYGRGEFRMTFCAAITARRPE